MLVKKTAIAAILTVILSMSSVYAQDSTSNSDSQITDSVKTTLKHSSIYRSVRVQTLDGVTYLYGTLDTPREVLEAREIAASAPGVKKIVSSLEYGSN